MRLIYRAGIALLAAIGLAGCPSTQHSQHAPSSGGGKPRAVVALALGGGASKGFAHIGVLKVLHENHIPVHIVTGTSAGALVGSLYASGMSPARLQTEAILMD